jgi:hypothetical protein
VAASSERVEISLAYAAVLLVAAIFFGYEWKWPRPLTASLTPTGKSYQSPQFFALAEWNYNLDIGLQSVPTTEATCLAARPKTGIQGEPLVLPANQPCQALEPPMGAIDWVVKKASSGEVINSGLTPGHGWDWSGPSEVSRVWYRIGYFRAEARGRYVIVLTLHDPQLPGGRYRPLLRVNAPPSFP